MHKPFFFLWVGRGGGGFLAIFLPIFVFIIIIIIIIIIITIIIIVTSQGGEIHVYFKKTKERLQETMHFRYTVL